MKIDSSEILSDWGQSDIGIDLGKTIPNRVFYLIGDNQILGLIWENQFTVGYFI